jgi:hypothetical protein
MFAEELMTLLRISPPGSANRVSERISAEPGLPPSQRITSIGVLVPARDEEDTIAECRWRTRTPGPMW